VWRLRRCVCVYGVRGIFARLDTCMCVNTYPFKNTCMCVCMCTCTRWLWWCIYVFEHEPYSTTKKEREKKTKRNLVVIPQRENTLLTPDWVNSRGHTSSCRCAVLKSGISHDLVNLLSLCYGYCSPLVKRDCNRCSKSSKLKKTWQSWVRAPLARS